MRAESLEFHDAAGPEQDALGAVCGGTFRRRVIAVMVNLVGRHRGGGHVDTS